MSRIGKAPIALPKGVSVECKGADITVKGPKGTNQGTLPADISLEIEDAELRFTRAQDSKKLRAMHGLVRALCANMVTGVSDGFKRGLEIHGVGYRASMSGKTLNLALGFSHPVEVSVPEGLSVSVDGTTKIEIEGIDKQLVGQFAADVRAIRPPEPYKEKGIRYVGERIRKKVGKAGATAAA